VAPDAGFERYRPLLDRNPFAPRLPRPAASPEAGSAPELPAVQVQTKEEPKTDQPPKPTAAAAAPQPPDPLKDWAYTGTVAIGDDVYAVLENKTAKRGEYVKVGGAFEGAIVQHIAQGEISVALGGQTRSLPKSGAFNPTPLNASAPTGPAPGGSPGPPGAPAGVPGRPSPPGPGAPVPGPTPPGGAVVPAGAVPVPPAAPAAAPALIRK
jgi:hypothetical protein